MKTVLAPMTTYSSHLDGVISDDEIPYLRRRAKGGFDVAMTAACCVHPSGWAFHGQWQCSDDRFLPSLRRVADAIHEGGSQAVLQIHHGGRQCPPELCGGQPVSASAIPSERPNAAVPRALADAEIREIIDAFAAAAVRAQKAGYEGVEIHGANTYLIQQFVSPHSNRRDDEWADPLAFPLAVTRAVRAAVPNIEVGYRFSPEEPETPGIRIDLTERLVDALLEERLDWLHISLRDYRQGSLHGDFEGPTLDRLAQRVAGRTRFIGVGGVKSWDDAEAVVKAGATEVAVGHCAISEPEWVDKAMAGEPIRTTLPREGMGEDRTIPKGLVEKILATPGWFEVE
ncbi:NADH-dependent flavin oxidoreductase [soil metagenome]